jgi:hypothetical protein
MAGQLLDSVYSKKTVVKQGYQPVKFHGATLIVILSAAKNLTLARYSSLRSE